MLNFEKKLKELNTEKEQILAKKQEIAERFDAEIKKVENKIKQLEDYKNEIGELTEKQVNILTSANDLAGPPAWIEQEGLSEPETSEAEDETRKVSI